MLACFLLHNSGSKSFRPPSHLGHSLENASTTRRFSFKFLKAWTSHDDCRRLVLEIWNKLVVASGMHRLQLKLQRVKEAFKLWNKFVFGDIHRRVHLACDEVNHIQLLIDLNGLTHDLYAQELQAHLVLTKAMNFHDQFWREKARNQSFILVIVILPIFT